MKIIKLLCYFVASLCALGALLMLMIKEFGAFAILAGVSVLLFVSGARFRTWDAKGKERYELHKREQENKAKEKEKASAERREKWADELKRTHEFKVTGVTFNNPDGSNRQRILKQAFDDASYESTLNVTDFNGEAAVEVLVDGSVCGYIAKADIKEVLELIPRAEKVIVYVEDFENEDDEIIYRADVHIIEGKP